MKKKIIILCLLVQAIFVLASHIRAGEILAKRMSSSAFQYEFTLVLYVSDAGVSIADSAEIFSDDGWKSGNKTWFDKTSMGNDVTRLKFKYQHTFSAGGTYKVKFLDYNRVANVLNMTASISTPFYIETSLLLDPLIGLNNSPILTVPPIDDGAKGQVYFYNPGAFDADGDSISYELVAPLQNAGIKVNNYTDPGSSTFSSGPTFLKMDPNNGTLEWNYPNVAGIYNIAYRVYEWRYIPLQAKYVKRGYIHRDMQIDINSSNNIKPEIDLPTELCLVVDELFDTLITATDSDGDLLNLIGYGSVFNISNSATLFTNSSANPVAGQFSWTPSCNDVQLQPYQVVFKASDEPSKNPSLVDIKTMELKVYGKPPENLTAIPNISQRKITLNWNTYICGAANEMAIWRKKCITDSIADLCMVADLSAQGFVKIATVPIASTSFIDDNSGFGLDGGVNYCYKIVADFPSPQRGSSIPSNEACGTTGLDAPLMMNVSVQQTGENNGRIFVRWHHPIQGTAPSNYSVYRGDGFEPDAWSVLTSANGVDTVYYDSDLNTKESPYTYYVETDLGVKSANASSVLLTHESYSKRITLFWEAFVPWSMTDQLYHYIFRKYEDRGDTSFILIDSVMVGRAADQVYIDTGQYSNMELENGDTICYYVLTQGIYCENPTVSEIVQNASQQICVVPEDLDPPCPPLLRVDSDCKRPLPNYNEAHWTSIISPSPCDDDIDYFEVYFAPDTKTPLTFLGTTEDTIFIHDNLMSITGCYAVRGIDINGNIGELSDSVCVQDCPEFLLPNIISPNGDEINDFFVPIPPIKGVLTISFSVYDRWGRLVYKVKEDTISSENINDLIRWNGTDQSGNILTDGIYFYVAEVEFSTLNPDNSLKKFKGWIQVVR